MKNDCAIVYYASKMDAAGITMRYDNQEICGTENDIDSILLGDIKEQSYDELIANYKSLFDEMLDKASLNAKEHWYPQKLNPIYRQLEALQQASDILKDAFQIYGTIEL